MEKILVKIRVVLIFITILGLKNVFSQESFLPLHTGDMFVFYNDNYSHGYHYYSYSVKRITKDSVFSNGYRYYFHEVFGAWIRYDSLTKCVLAFADNYNCGIYHGERLVDSLNVHLNDSVKFCSGGIPKMCTFAGDRYILGSNISTIEFDTRTQSAPTMYTTISYSKGIGITQTGSAVFLYSSSVSNLKGAVINGIQYGNLYSGPDTVNSPYLPIYTNRKCIFYSITNPAKIIKQYWLNDTSISGRRFVKNTIEGGYISYDTGKGNVIKPAVLSCGGYNLFQKSDSIKSSVGDTVRFCSGLPEKVLVAEKDTIIFTSYSRIKTFKYTLNGKTLYKTYAKNWGIVRYDVVSEDGSIESFALKGMQWDYFSAGDTNTIYFNFNQPQVTNMNYTFDENSLQLNWTTNYEYGMRTIYIEKRDTVYNFYRVEKTIDAKGIYSNTQVNYSTSVPLDAFGKYDYRLRLVNQGWTAYSYFDKVNYLPPASIELFQNYPNPFNGTTKIKFNTNASVFVNLSVFDISGRKVFEAVNESLPAGYYSRTISTIALPSGIYFYTLKAGEFKETRKMILVK
ncbi:MAG: T9SS type A sorting domain-containing protein [Bacteroidetes bacterium]|nr:T9SS type A sorting domain-containing protein [Bacteroidota bacterium]